MRKTFLLSLALSGVGVVADGSETGPVRVSSLRLLRSSASTVSLPQFPERKRLEPQEAVEALFNEVRKVDGLVSSVRKDGNLELYFDTRDGLSIGDTFDVYRPNGVYLARIVIRELSPEFVVAEPVPKTVRGKLGPGDRLYKPNAAAL